MKLKGSNTSIQQVLRIYEGGKIMRKSRKGFTLVELLIVIAVLGALAASMSLSAKDATPKAQAARILNDFKILKTAVMLYNFDSRDEGPTTANAITYFNNHSGDYLAGKLKQFTVAADTTNTNQWNATYTGPLSAAAWAALETDANDLGIESKDNKGLVMRIF